MPSDSETTGSQIEELKVSDRARAIAVQGARLELETRVAALTAIAGGVNREGFLAVCGASWDAVNDRRDVLAMGTQVVLDEHAAKKVAP